MHFPDWLVWYKKPEYRDIKEYSTAISSGRRAFSPDGRSKVTVPSRLKLERILENRTCSPMSLYDFYMYLKYIEFSPENLEFYIWFKNYEMQWAKLAADSAASSEKDADSLLNTPTTPVHPLEKLPTVNVSQISWDPEIGQDTLAHIAQLISINVAMCSASECRYPARTVASKSSFQDDGHLAPGDNKNNTTNTNTHRDSYSGLFTSNLPQSAELRAVIKTYLSPGSDKELNIPPSLRSQALRALHASSGDPVHLRPVAEHVYLLIKNCSHRNFVRLGVSNGTYETVCVATGLGIVLTLAGFLYVLLRCLWPGIGSHSRWESVGAWPMWWLGVSLILSGVRGSCFFLLLFSRRQPLPWERFDDDARGGNGEGGGGGIAGAFSEARRGRGNPILRALSRLMIFDRKLKVKDEHLRRLQFRIVIQSLVSGAVFASAAVLVFLFLPVWAETVRR